MKDSRVVRGVVLGARRGYGPRHDRGHGAKALPGQLQPRHGRRPLGQRNLNARCLDAAIFLGQALPSVARETRHLKGRARNSERL